ncbi:hypothetical protein L9F63_011552 [Diploptera punctata]|uniref:Alkaline phosphatase n=1 Tax=Diploptera punctata TaxID=6984 RepID=A0AAD8AED2_DIPPU|nr:hypothetical protein L9F63_011552 [Diploptera punctata]
MGMSTITATRIFKNQQAGGLGEENLLSFEEFPYIGIARTYEVDYQVPDSAGTATAMLAGVKINANLAGLDSRAKWKICDRAINEEAKLENLITWAQKAGKHTGFATTTRITHATLAAMYAHINDRYWECDSKIPPEYKDCVKDVARQLVEDEPGKNLNVVLGGGLNQMGVPVKQGDYIYCTRDDKQNLVEKWKQDRKSYLFVNTTKDLMSADLNKIDYLMGLFSPGHIPYVSSRDNSPEGQPSLVNMTAQAIKLLSRNPKGYILLVEGGNIDNAHHEGTARRALEETSELADAVAYAVSATNEDDTLIVVTSDHSHTLSISGYPGRGSDILGSDNVLDILYGQDILSYANGPGYLSHKSDNCLEAYWRKFTDKERKDPAYKQFSGRYVNKETHAGEDVPVYSRGPQANLFSGVFEQHYIAHAICYIACIGPHTTYCNYNKHPASRAVSSATYNSSPLLFIFSPTLLLLMYICHN